MKYGRTLAIAGILFACLLGCSVHRTGSMHDSGRSEEQGRYDLLYARTDAKVATTNTAVDRFRNVRIHWLSYDTDKPADASGKHPVKAEGWVDGDEQESATQDTDTAENSTQGAQVNGEQNKSDSFDRTEDKGLEAEAGTRPLWWWLVGLLSALAGIIFIYWKYGKKDKTK